MNTLPNLTLLLLGLGVAAACNDEPTADDGSTGGGAGLGGGVASGGDRASGGSASGGRSDSGGNEATGGSAMGGQDGGGSAGDDAGGAGPEQAIVPLGASAPFAVLASAAITNIPTSSITGDIGLSPDAGSNISGFSAPGSCPEVMGTVYAVDVTGPACATVAPEDLADAKADAGVAFENARAAARGTPIAISGDLNGLTLYPGLYESGSSLELSPGGLVYLDAQGNDDAVFILRSETSITTESTSEVVLQGGAQAANVFWTAGSTVTLGTDSIMKGTFLAGTSVALLTGAHLEGRVLNQGTAAEAITLDACTIVVPAL